MSDPGLSTRPLTADDLARVLEIRVRSFGPTTVSVEQGAIQQAPLLEAGRILGVIAEEQVVAAAKILPMRQSWGGQAVSMAGISGVVVAPEHRGRGVGTLLMRAAIHRALELGHAVSALYPATVPIYRSLGWELAGVRHRVSVPSHLLRGLGGREVEVRRATPADTDAVLAVERDVLRHGREHGPLLHTPEETHRQLEDPDVFSYVCDDGFVRYGWHDGDLVVHQLVAGSQASLRALWSVLGSGSSIAQNVLAYVGPGDPVHLLLPGTAAERGHIERWMLRLLDLPAAFADRGYPPAVSGEAPLRIDDPEVPAANGSWLLRVADGTGALEPTDPDADSARLGARGLAALYAGVPVATLRAAGLLSAGTSADDAVLGAALAGDAYLLDFF